MRPAKLSWLVLIVSIASGFAQTNSWDDLRNQARRAQKARHEDRKLKKEDAPTKLDLRIRQLTERKRRVH
jgi:hypothetical protein